MPVIAQLYIIAYCGFCLWCGYEDIKTRYKHWILGDIILETGSVIVAAAYWMPAIRNIIEPFALLLFAGGFVWNLIEAIIGYRKLYYDKKLPSYRNVRGSMTGVFIGAVSYAPLFVWGFCYTVLGRTA